MKAKGKKMITEEMEKALIKKFTDAGWKCDRNDENYLGFSFYEDENREWVKDYNKKTGSFVHFNGRIKINLRQTKS